MRLAALQPVSPRARELLARGARAWRTHATATDAALVAVLLLVLAAAPTPAALDPGDASTAPWLTLWGHWHATWWAWLLQVALVVPLTWRRRAPMAVFLAIASVALMQWLAGPELYGDVALLVAVYSVAVHATRPVFAGVAVGAISVLAAVLAAARWASGSGVALAPVVITFAMTLALPAALGLVIRARRHALAAARERGSRAERVRIAREMHDVIAHTLSVMIALADGARLTMERDPASAGAVIGQVSATGRDALAQMRGLLGVLHERDEDAPLQPQPGLEQLPELAAAVRAAGLEVRLVVYPGSAVPSGVALTTYRVVQEALTNVLKHGRAATYVAVTVRRGEAGLDIDVRDDGPRTAMDAGRPGLGIGGMAARAAAHGGTFEAGPVDPTGWRVRASLPLNRSAR
jgi:signal transduction histidine kinase